MWPRPIGRGIAAVEQSQPGVVVASMWPRPIGRGIGHAMTETLGDAYPLQCGRGRSAAESSDPDPDRERSQEASMWPRPIGRGIQRVLAAEPAVLLRASMWPRPIGRGIKHSQKMPTPYT